MPLSLPKKTDFGETNKQEVPPVGNTKVFAEGSVCVSRRRPSFQEAARAATMEAEIQAFLTAYVAATHEMYTGFSEEKFDAYVATFTSGIDMTFIRPSGNPMDMSGFRAMWSSGMIEDASSELVSVDSVQATGLFSCWPAALPSPPGAVAVVTYTTHDKFTYGNTINDDLAKFSIMLAKGLGGWKICHAHRATGQPPSGP